MARSKKQCDLSKLMEVFMKKLLIILIILFLLFIVGCQDKEVVAPQENQNIVQPQVNIQSNPLDTTKSNLIQDQYWRTIMDLYSKIAKSCISLDYEKKLSEISYNKESKNNILRIKENIKSYKLEIEKTKLDMLKYYNGNPPDPFFQDLSDVENRYLNEYTSCIDSCSY